ncbi:hypothetical protein SKAU_G00391680 [Synaphobranchus kaupii]|uniref:Uncharacterized protein n=1 Tax=Synaphobranchus kaupii TaxID=118154 RepID=A0A9Q1EBR7_SYNKA|nr:hypothetical protein SKAU_G00391680 [Synaphobranchus kaupii]
MDLPPRDDASCSPAEWERSRLASSGSKSGRRRPKRSQKTHSALDGLRLNHFVKRILSVDREKRDMLNACEEGFAWGAPGACPPARTDVLIIEALSRGNGDAGL